MTIEQFALIMIRDQNEDSSDADLLDVVKVWVEDAIDELLAYHDWDTLRRTKTFTTDTVTSVYTLEAGVREIRAMRFKDTNEPIQYLDDPVLYSIAEDLEQKRKPQFWFYESSAFVTDQVFLKIQLDSIPDSPYVIEYAATIDPLSETSVNINIPVQRQMFQALKHRVKAFFYEQDREVELMTTSLQQFYAAMNRAMEKDNVKADNNLRLQVRDISNTKDRRLAHLDPNHF